MCDIAEVYHVDKRKARKAHRCEECHGTIPAGEVYCFHHGVFDGAGFSNKVCVDCEELRTELNKKLDLYDQICIGELCDVVMEDDDAIIDRFIQIKVKRGGKIWPWMQTRLDTPAQP